MTNADLFGAEAEKPRRSPLGRGHSGYDRHAFDAYFTEPAATRALVDAVDLLGPVWEPAAGRGDMAKVLIEAGLDVVASDLVEHGRCDGAPSIATGVDFLEQMIRSPTIITNPPYGKLARRFVERALALTLPVRGQVAMFLRHDWDCPASRMPLFADHPAFDAKITLTWRPRWDWWERDKPKASPRECFAWFVWDWAREKGLPRKLYARKEEPAQTA